MSSCRSTVLKKMLSIHLYRGFFKIKPIHAEKLGEQSEEKGFHLTSRTISTLTLETRLKCCRFPLNNLKMTSASFSISCFPDAGSSKTRLHHALNSR